MHVWFQPRSQISYLLKVRGEKREKNKVEQDKENQIEGKKKNLQLSMGVVHLHMDWSGENPSPVHLGTVGFTPLTLASLGGAT